MSFIIVIIILALIFDYINGFHDAANSIATIVSTKVLTPFQAVFWAAFFNFAAFIISIWFLYSFRKDIMPRVISVLVILLVLFFLQRTLVLDKAILIKNTHFKTYLWQVVFYTGNFKWILLGFILLVFAVFTFWL